MSITATINITTQIPEGYEIDRENSTLDNIILKQIKNKKPKWEDFGKVGGYFINSLSKIIDLPKELASITNKNTIPTKELAEAMLALCQLINWRDKYNEGWKADFINDYNEKFVIHNYSNRPKKDSGRCYNSILVFKTKEIKNKFFEDFEDLITIALPLL